MNKRQAKKRIKLAVYYAMRSWGKDTKRVKWVTLLETLTTN